MCYYKYVYYSGCSHSELTLHNLCPEARWLEDTPSDLRLATVSYTSSMVNHAPRLATAQRAAEREQLRKQKSMGSIATGQTQHGSPNTRKVFLTKENTKAVTLEAATPEAWRAPQANKGSHLQAAAGVGNWRPEEIPSRAPRLRGMGKQASTPKLRKSKATPSSNNLTDLQSSRPHSDERRGQQEVTPGKIRMSNETGIEKVSRPVHSIQTGHSEANSAHSSCSRIPRPRGKTINAAEHPSQTDATSARTSGGSLHLDTTDIRSTAASSVKGGTVCSWKTEVFTEHEPISSESSGTTRCTTTEVEPHLVEKPTGISVERVNPLPNDLPKSRNPFNPFDHLANEGRSTTTSRRSSATTIIARDGASDTWYKNFLPGYAPTPTQDSANVDVPETRTSTPASGECQGQSSLSSSPMIAVIDKPPHASAPTVGEQSQSGRTSSSVSTNMTTSHDVEVSTILNEPTDHSYSPRASCASSQAHDHAGHPVAAHRSTSGLRAEAPDFKASFKLNPGAPDFVPDSHAGPAIMANTYAGQPMEWQVEPSLPQNSSLTVTSMEPWSMPILGAFGPMIPAQKAPKWSNGTAGKEKREVKRCGSPKHKPISQNRAYGSQWRKLYRERREYRVAGKQDDSPAGPAIQQQQYEYYDTPREPPGVYRGLFSPKRQTNIGWSRPPRHPGQDLPQTFIEPNLIQRAVKDNQAGSDYGNSPYPPPDRPRFLPWLTLRGGVAKKKSNGRGIPASGACKVWAPRNWNPKVGQPSSLVEACGVAEVTEALEWCGRTCNDCARDSHLSKSV